MKFTDVNPFNKKIQKRINKSILDTVKKKDFILENNVNKFEKKFSKLSKSKYAVGCATGTDALILALKSLNLKPKTVDCENFQNQSTIEKLQSTSNLHTQNLGSLNGIIANINSNIKKIEDKLKGMKQKK